MSMEIDSAEANEDVSVVRLSGRLDTTTVEALKAKMLSAVTESKAGVIFDLDDVNFIGSAGLRAILAAQKEAESRGKPLALIRARPPVYKIFKIAALDKVFEFFEDERDALRALWR